MHFSLLRVSRSWYAVAPQTSKHSCKRGINLHRHKKELQLLEILVTRQVLFMTLSY